MVVIEDAEAAEVDGLRQPLLIRKQRRFGSFLICDVDVGAEEPDAPFGVGGALDQPSQIRLPVGSDDAELDLEIPAFLRGTRECRRNTRPILRMQSGHEIVERRIGVGLEPVEQHVASGPHGIPAVRVQREMAHTGQRLGAPEAILAIPQQRQRLARFGDVGDGADHAGGLAGRPRTLEERLRPRVHPADHAVGADDPVLEVVAAVAGRIVRARHRRVARRAIVGMRTGANRSTVTSSSGGQPKIWCTSGEQ
jgi:hypothetical protein